MKRIGLLIFIAMTCVLWANTLPEVSNLSFAQRTDGSMLIDVYYDVLDADGDTLTVTMQSSDDGGENWTVSCDSIFGDIGENIVSGTGKQIIWNFGAEHPGVFSEEYRVRILVDDSYIEQSNGMILVEGGTFEMGDHFDEGSDDELPVHEVTLNSFYIGQYEVTQGEYESLMGSNPANDYGIGDNYPVYYVTWYNAVEYCNALSILESLTPCYDLSDWSCDFSADGYRLPTESEWEYASRGGIYWTDNYRYSGTTDNLGDYAWYYSNSGGQTHEVGIKLPNQLDIYDMTGNVYDWCNDRSSWSYYSYSPANNPTGPVNGSDRVVRGGCWNSIDNGCRVANRYGDPPGISNLSIGFRLLRAIISENTAPDMPENPSPENGAIDVPVNASLGWECSDPEGDELSYDVYFGEIPELDISDLVAENITEEGWVLENLNINTYYWKITASDGEFETEGEVWNFTTMEEGQSGEWCLVPAGEFTWGEDDEIQTIDYDYEIMKYEITNIQYLSYLEEALAAGDVWINGNVYGHYDGDEYFEAGDYALYVLGTPYNYNYAQISFDGNSFIINVPFGYSAGDFDDHPVVKISWFGANAYAEHYGWRLPTEQEWEKAARGMTGYEYPWGDVISGDRANYLDSGDPWDNGTTPVGYYNGENGTINSPSPYGCYDMCGNVFIWTDSWYGGSYFDHRVLKGGAWEDHSLMDYLRTWYRGYFSPTGASCSAGFRCASTVEVSAAPDMPDNPSPVNDAIDVPVNTSLSWECSDPEGDELSYDVYFGEIPELDINHLVAEDITEEGWVLENLNINTTYYWKITASDGEFETEGEVWNFTTIEEVLLEGMVFVEGGTFEMGDHFNEGGANELPVHEVTLNSFYIGQYEVTQAEYSAIMGSNPAHDWGVGDNYPVYYTTWYNAVEYCNALSIQEGLTPCYDLSDWSCDFSADGYRLPTEAEWEYASRGGINWTDNYRYSGCHEEIDLGDYAWYQSNSGSHTHEVGTQAPNQLDIYDMTGNVFEWCNDRYSTYYYSSSPANNPTGPDSGSYRLHRGGNWYTFAYLCRVTYRFNGDPGYGYSRLGFRILRAVE